MADPKTPDSTITLSDGRVVTLAPAKGRHQLQAMRLTNDPNALALAVAATVGTIDGAPLIFEDVLEWPLRDVLLIQNAITEQLGELPTPAPGA
jgi:hypothetical protein